MLLQIKLNEIQVENLVNLAITNGYQYINFKTKELRENQNKEAITFLLLKLTNSEIEGNSIPSQSHVFL